MSALFARWQETIHAASACERLMIVKDYMGAVWVSGFALGGIVALFMEWRVEKAGRHGILRYTPAVGYAIFLAVVLLGNLVGYTLVGSLVAGRFNPPTCAARMPTEGPDALPCILKELGGWAFKFAMGERAGFGELMPMSKVFAQFIGAGVFPLLFFLANPEPESPSDSQRKAVLKLDHKEIGEAEKRVRSTETQTSVA